MSDETHPRLKATVRTARTSFQAMKRLIVISCLVISLQSPLFAQVVTDELDVKRVNDDILYTLVPSAARKQVVKRIVTWYFKSPKKPQTIYVAAQNIQKEWLPTIRNIEFVILEKQPPKGYERKVYFFRPLEMQKGSFLLPFGYGDPDCDSIGDTWSFRVNGSRVKQLKQAWLGWGTGCATGSGVVGYLGTPKTPRGITTELSHGFRR